MKITLLSFIFLITTLCGYSRHITGGEMRYDLLSSTPFTRTFRITLVLFRDENCTGNCADMPSFVRIGIFNNDNNEPYNGPGTLPTLDANLNRTEVLPIINIPRCIVSAPNLNYTAGYYAIVVTLKNNIGGYTAAYQTCCRIENINNITVEPGTNGAGATYSTIIPGSDFNNVPILDNSPKFEKGISILCFNKEFTLDFSASDQDGDRLVYSLVSAYDGGTAQNASNITPSLPPYGGLDYSSGFSGLKPLGNRAVINAQTGIITGIAPEAGRYVVSVSVKAYRNSVLLTTHRKDFIITVAECDFASANLNSSYINCENYTIDFTNITPSPLNETFSWNFGDPASGVSNVSNLENPTHIFSGAGSYGVQYIVNPGTGCADTVTAQVKIYPGFFPEIASNNPSCKGKPVLLRDLTRTNFGVVNNWHWDFGLNNATNDTSNIRNPQFVFQDTGTFTASLIVGTNLGCVDTVYKTIKIVKSPTLKATNDTLICSADFLQLTATCDIPGNFTWTPNYNINNTSVPNPIIHPSVNTVYYLNFIDAVGCIALDTVKVNVVDFVTLNAAIDTTICLTDTIKLRVESNGLLYHWTPENVIENPIVKEPLAIPRAMLTTFYVQGNIGSCFARDSIKVKTVPYPIPNAGNDTSICWGTNATLHASGGVFYSWSPTNFLSDTTSPNPTVINPNPGFIDFVVTVRDVNGCPKPVKDIVRLNINRIIADAGPRDTALAQNQPLYLHATGSTNYLWTPVTQWLNNPFIADPISTPQDNIEYVVKVSNSIGCFDTDTINVRYYKVEPDFYIPNAFTPNGDGLNDVIKPIAIGMKTIDKFIVLNRWGQTMFSTTRTGKGWDGKINGITQTTGTYIYYIEGKKFNNQAISTKGTFLLIK
jgi:gliding motility-associated-like protein